MISPLSIILNSAYADGLKGWSLSFLFYSYDCSEPRHMHMDQENKSAKFWLDPDVTLANNHGYRC